MLVHAATLPSPLLIWSSAVPPAPLSLRLLLLAAALPAALDHRHPLPVICLCVWFSRLALRQRLVVSGQGRAASANVVACGGQLVVSLSSIIPYAPPLVLRCIPLTPHTTASPWVCEPLETPGGARDARSGCAQLVQSAPRAPPSASVAGISRGSCTGANTGNTCTGVSNSFIHRPSWKSQASSRSIFW